MARDLNKRLFLDILTLLALLFALFPVAYLFNLSVKPERLLYAIPPRFVFIPTFKAYVNLLIEERGYVFFINSIIVSAFATIAALTFGSLGAFGFSYFNFKGKTFWFFLVLLTRMFPPVTTLVPVYFAIKSIGLLDTRLALILLYTSFQIPLVVWVMRSFFRGVPTEVVESALLDGCSLISAFAKIVVPLATPGLLAAGVLIFVLNWNEFLFALTLTSWVAKTAPVAIMSLLNQEARLQWTALAAMGFSTIFPILLFMAVLGRYLIRGLTAGALKG